jgi:hypothetical protein
MFATATKVAKKIENTVTLYRAIGIAEANSILKIGKFSLGVGQMERKFFATSRINAGKWRAEW